MIPNPKPVQSAMAARPRSAAVRTEPGQGGLPRLVVATPAATAEIYLQGAHVTAWTPAGQDPVIWLSKHSVFAPGAPIRGGVPLCFPWFGPDPAGSGPLHGFARIADWTLAEVAEAGDEVAVTLTLSEASAQAAAWRRFSAQYTVTVGATLTLALEVTNTGSAPIEFQEAMHTYLAVGDIRGATITGLEGSAYNDRLGPGRTEAAGAPLRIEGETDRVYQQPGTVVLQDPAGRRTLSVAATGSADAVVWNPWIAKAKAMGDFGDHEWPEMVCVETANVLDNAVALQPGEAATMTAVIAATPAGGQAMRATRDVPR